MTSKTNFLWFHAHCSFFRSFGSKVEHPNFRAESSIKSSFKIMKIIVLKILQA
jgi:hypothetical protein